MGWRLYLRWTNSSGSFFIYLFFYCSQLNSLAANNPKLNPKKNPEAGPIHVFNFNTPPVA